jgi:5-formyltetrahydrofolate cyclo-ligase
MPPEPATGPALREAKRALRTSVLAARDALPDALRAAASRAIGARIAGLPEFAAAPTVLLTLPFRSEWDTRALVAQALDAGKAVLLPRVDPATRMLALHRVTDLARDVDDGYRGIPEPRAGTPLAPPDRVALALVPGVAFDGGGRRLGYGGGFYDRLLPLLPRGALRVAGAFDVQLVERVPAALHDATVEVLVTPGRTLDLRARDAVPPP